MAVHNRMKENTLLFTLSRTRRFSSAASICPSNPDRRNILIDYLEWNNFNWLRIFQRFWFNSMTNSTIDSNKLYESIAGRKLYYLWKEFVCQLEINVTNVTEAFWTFFAALCVWRVPCGEFHSHNVSDVLVFDLRDDCCSALSGVLSFATSQFYIIFKSKCSKCSWNCFFRIWQSEWRKRIWISIRRSQ